MDIFSQKTITPAGYASQLRYELNLPSVIDPASICERLGVAYAEDDFDGAAGFYGMLLWNGETAGIFVNSNIDYPGKKRFTGCHEIGHFYMVNHARVLYKCSEEDIEHYDSRNPIEREAQEFASELLLPENEVLIRLRAARASMSLAKELASFYGASLTAAAIKMVSLCPDNCALVFSRRGRIVWSSCSKKFRFQYKVKDKGSEIRDTWAEDIIKRIWVGDEERDVGPSSWLSSASPKYIGGLSHISEHSIGFGRLDATLSLISIPYHESCEDEEIDAEDVPF